MSRLSPLTRAWVYSVWRPFWVACLLLTMISSLVLAAQVILRAPLAPGPEGLVLVWLSLLPETLGILAPAALFVAVVVAAQKWVRAGDLAALSVSGCGPISLFRPTLLMGLVVAFGVAFCAQILGPWGRGVAHSTMASAADSYRIRPATLVQLGDVWVRAGRRSDSGLHDVTVIGEEWMAWAPSARWEEGRGIHMLDGGARGIDSTWSLSFASATVNFEGPRKTTHNLARSHASLRSLIRRMELKGRDASKERLALYKRTTLPTVVPLLALLGLPLGAMMRRPYLTTVLFILSLWAIQRLGDHGAVQWGAELVAGFPLMLVFALCLGAWLRWLK